MTIYGERLDLDTPLRILEGIERAADGRGQNCIVQKASLSALLRDHHRMVDRLRELGVNPEAWDGEG